MKFRLLTLFCFILLTEFAFAQKDAGKIPIKGIVVDEEKRPLDLVQVVLLDSVGNITHYAFTEENGSFIFDITVENLSIIKFTRVGYEKKQIVWKDWANNPIIMKLSSSSLLREVVVKNKSLVEDSGDTLSYIVQNVRDGSEKKLEDVLEKLPGIQINKTNGQIKYQGKEISKILLDGDDLTGENYKMLSKGLSADWLEEVQVLKKFTGNKLLQGVKKSEEIALNIRIKENAKANVFGNASIGLGTWNRADIKSEILKYSKKTKGFWITEATNLGETIEVLDLETFKAGNSNIDGFQKTSLLLDGSTPAPSLFNEALFNFQKGIYTNPNFLIKPNSKTKFKGNTAVTIRERDFFTSDSSFFFNEQGEGFSINQSQNQKTQFRDFYQDLEWTKAINSSKELSFTGRLSLKTENNFTDFKNQFRHIEQSVEQHKSDAFLSSKYILKRKENEAIQMQVIFHVENLQEDFSFHDKDIITNNLPQSFFQNNLNIGFKTEHLKKWGKNTFTEINVNLSQSNQKFSRVENPSSSLFILPQNRQREGSSYFSASTLWKNISLWGSLKARAIDAQSSVEKTSFLFIEPTIKINQELKFKKDWHLTNMLAWSESNNTLTAMEWFPINFQSSFRQFIANETDFKLAEQTNLSVFKTQLRKNTLNYLSLSGELVIRNSRNGIYQILSYVEDQAFETRKNGLRASDVTALVSASKYISSLALLVSTSYTNSNSKSPFGLGTSVETSVNKNETLSFSTGFVGIDRIKISAGYNFNKLSNTWNQNSFDFAYRSFNGMINYEVFENLRMRLQYEGLNFNQQTNSLNSVFKTELTHTPKSKKIELSLLYHNILDNRSLQLIQISPGINNTSSFSILKSFILLNCKFNF